MHREYNHKGFTVTKIEDGYHFDSNGAVTRLFNQTIPGRVIDYMKGLCEIDPHCCSKFIFGASRTEDGKIAKSCLYL